MSERSFALKVLKAYDENLLIAQHPEDELAFRISNGHVCALGVFLRFASSAKSAIPEEFDCPIPIGGFVTRLTQRLHDQWYYSQRKDRNTYTLAQLVLPYERVNFRGTKIEKFFEANSLRNADQSLFLDWLHFLVENGN